MKAVFSILILLVFLVVVVCCIVSRCVCAVAV
jgi:hypothetical protein